MQAATVTHVIVAAKIQIHFELLVSAIQQMIVHMNTPFTMHMKVVTDLQTKILIHVLYFLQFACGQSIHLKSIAYHMSEGILRFRHT